MPTSIKNMERYSFTKKELARITIVYLICYYISFSAAGQIASRITHKEQPISFSTIDTSQINKLIATGNKLTEKFPDSAIEKFRTTFLLSKDARYIDGVAKALLGIGNSHVVKRNYAEAIRFYNMALPYCKYAPSSKKLLPQYYLNIWMPYYKLGNNDSLAFYMFAAVKEAERIKDTFFLARAYSNIGGFWINNEIGDKAMYYLKKAEKFSLESKSYSVLPFLYIQIGMAYGLKNDWHKAGIYTKYGVAWSIKEKDHGALSKAYSFLGETYLSHNMPDSALYYYNKSLTVEGGNSLERRLTALLNMGEAYNKIGNHNKSLYYYTAARKLADSVGIKNHRLASLWFNLAVGNNNLGNYKKAIQFFELYTNLRDSLLNAERNLSIDNLDAKYRTAEKDKELAINQLLLARQKSQLREKNIWIISISCFVISLIVLFGLGYRNHHHRQRLQKEYIRNLEQKQEINHLTSVMKGEEKERTRLARELHDGIMVQLSTVRMNLKSLPAPYKALQEVPYYKQTIDLLENVSKELRQTAHNLMPDMLLEGGISEAVFYFCKTIEQNTKINITFQQHEALPRFNREFEMSIYRIVQELVQNIIKHAHADSAIVQLIYRHDVLFLTVTDDGIGFEIQNLTNDIAGMGLKSIRSRVSVMNGTMDIQTKKNEGTSIYLEFDLHNNIQS